MSNTPTKYFEVEGPVDKAARYLTDRDLFIVRVEGSNGCDFKNETAESYIVLVREHDGFSSDEETYRLNHDLLTGYHAGDREHYLKRLREDTHDALRIYVAESLGLPSFVMKPAYWKLIDEALANIDKAVWADNWGVSK